MGISKNLGLSLSIGDGDFVFCGALNFFHRQWDFRFSHFPEQWGFQISQKKVLKTNKREKKG
jgi:hypothetical protein